MTQDVMSDGPQPASEDGSVAVPTTGIADVDRVLSELDRLDERPPAEHLEAFENAHAALRSALDQAPDQAPDPGREGGPGSSA